MVRNGSRSVVGTVVVSLLASVLVVAAAPAPAGADPAVSVSPDTVVDGGVVTVVATGFLADQTIYSIGLCDRRWAEQGDPASAPDEQDGSVSAVFTPISFA